MHLSYCRSSSVDNVIFMHVASSVAHGRRHNLLLTTGGSGGSCRHGSSLGGGLEGASIVQQSTTIPIYSNSICKWSPLARRNATISARAYKVTNPTENRKSFPLSLPFCTNHATGLERRRAEGSRSAVAEKPSFPHLTHPHHTLPEPRLRARGTVSGTILNAYTVTTFPSRNSWKRRLPETSSIQGALFAASASTERHGARRGRAVHACADATVSVR